MRAAVFLGHAQADGVTSVMLRSRSRDYANHHVTVDKHPHTGRVLRTVRLALAANIGPYVDWNHRNTWAGLRLCPEDLPDWLRVGSPVNLLRCEE